MTQENTENTKNTDVKQELEETVLNRVFGKEALMNVDVDLSVVLGRTFLRVYQLLKLGRGAVVELNQHLDDSVEILANDIPIAEGEVIITDSGHIAVKVTKLKPSSKGRQETLIGKSSVGAFGK